MALSLMTGPRKIIDLNPDETPQLKLGVAYQYRGRIWQTEKIGCVQCLDDYEQEAKANEDEDAGERPRRTLSYADEGGNEHFLCMKHGPIESVNYSIVKKYEIVIGDFRREDEVRLDDIMLFPVSMVGEEREAFIMRMLDEQEEYEAETGPV